MWLIWPLFLFNKEFYSLFLIVYSCLPITWACSPIKILTIFQPARPFLLHKNEQGGHPYLVPCSLNRACLRNRETRVQININEKYALLFLILYLMSAKYPNYFFVFSGQNSITYFWYFKNLPFLGIIFLFVFDQWCQQ